MLKMTMRSRCCPFPGVRTPFWTERGVFYATVRELILRNLRVFHQVHNNLYLLHYCWDPKQNHMVSIKTKIDRFYMVIFQYNLYIFVHVISLEPPKVLKKCSQNGGRVWYWSLELIKNSLLENKSKCRYVILYNQALSKFYTHKSSWLRGHGGKMYAHGDVFLFMFFVIWSRIFSSFSLSFPPFSFAFSCIFCMPDHLSCAW